MVPMRPVSPVSPVAPIQRRTFDMQISFSHPFRALLKGCARLGTEQIGKAHL